MKILKDILFVLLFAVALTAFVIGQIFLIYMCTSGKFDAVSAILLFVFAESCVIGVVCRLSTK